MKTRQFRNPRVLAFVEKFGGRTSEPEKVLRRVMWRMQEKVWGEHPRPPFLPDAAKEAFGVSEIKADPRLLVEAGLVEQNGQYFVLVNPNGSRERQNFAIYHEFCHILFTEAAKEVRPYLTRADRLMVKKTYQEEEFLCNRGATELLLPARDFSAKINRQLLSWSLIAGLAGLYEASLEATLWRFAELYQETFWLDKWRSVDGVPVRDTAFCSRELRHLAGAMPVSVWEAVSVGRWSTVELQFKGEYTRFGIEPLLRVKSDNIKEFWCLVAPEATFGASPPGLVYTSGDCARQLSMF